MDDSFSVTATTGGRSGSVQVFLIIPHWRMSCFYFERERKRETERDGFSPARTPTGDQTHNLGVRPDRGSDPQPFGVQDSAATNGAPWPGLYPVLDYYKQRLQEHCCECLW